jgi:hypothetical protein
MRHSHDFHGTKHGRPESRGYRPSHAWLGTPGDGPVIRSRRPGRRWHFRAKQLRILLLAALLGWTAWSQLAARHVDPVAAARGQD